MSSVSRVDYNQQITLFIVIVRELLESFAELLASVIMRKRSIDAILFHGISVHCGEALAQVVL